MGRAQGVSRRPTQFFIPENIVGRLDLYTQKTGLYPSAVLGLALDDYFDRMEGKISIGEDLRSRLNSYAIAIGSTEEAIAFAAISDFLDRGQSKVKQIMGVG